MIPAQDLEEIIMESLTLKKQKIAELIFFLAQVKIIFNELFLTLPQKTI